MDVPQLPVTCLTCGFLCRRDGTNPHLPLYYEITLEDRQNGRFFGFGGDALVPWSFRRVPIYQEVQTHPEYPDGPGKPIPDFNRGAHNRAVAEVIRRDRLCDRWFPYSPGFTPKEHLEELNMLQLEQERKKFELELFAESQRTQRWMVGIAAFQAIVAIVALVLTSWLSNHPTPTAPAPAPPAIEAPAGPKPAPVDQSVVPDPTSSE